MSPEFYSPDLYDLLSKTSSGAIIFAIITMIACVLYLVFGGIVNRDRS
jgi:hypothetical protein